MEVVLDLETTWSYKTKYVRGQEKAVSDIGSPFNNDNRIVCVGVHSYDEGFRVFDFLGNDTQQDLVDFLKKYDTIVGHNIKYDVHWLRKVGVDTRGVTLIDTLVNENLLTGGKDTYGKLSLDKVAPKYGGTTKVDLIKKLWKAGVNTDEIPKHLLHQYQYLDVYNTRKIWEGQKRKFNND